MKTGDIEPVYLTIPKLFKNAKRTTIAEDVRKELEEKRRRTILDPEDARRAQAWSGLLHQVVGGEVREEDYCCI